MRVRAEFHLSKPKGCSIAVDQKETREYTLLSTRFDAASFTAPTLVHRAVVDITPEYAVQRMKDGAWPSPGSFTRLACPCSICVPMRVAIQDFHFASEHRRVMARNAHLEVGLHKGVPPFVKMHDTEHAQLYMDHMQARFPGGNDTPRDITEAKTALKNLGAFPGMDAMHINLRDENGVLRGCNVFHVAGKSSYATAFFYDPALRQNSIGMALTLHVIAYLREQGFEHQYLGVVSRVPSAYSWKDQLTPMDLLIDGRWQRFNGKGDFRGLRVNPALGYPAPRRLGVS